MSEISHPVLMAMENDPGGRYRKGDKATGMGMIGHEILIFRNGNSFRDDAANWACLGGRHNWEEEYYGWRCADCDAFVPFGCEPWAYYD